MAGAKRQRQATTSHADTKPRQTPPRDLLTSCSPNMSASTIGAKGGRVGVSRCNRYGRATPKFSASISNACAPMDRSRRACGSCPSLKSRADAFDRAISTATRSRWCCDETPGEGSGDALAVRGRGGRALPFARMAWSREALSTKASSVSTAEYHSVSLGPRFLRADTGALVALALRQPCWATAKSTRQSYRAAPPKPPNANATRYPQTKRKSP